MLRVYLTYMMWKIPYKYWLRLLQNMKFPYFASKYRHINNEYATVIFETKQENSFLYVFCIKKIAISNFSFQIKSIKSGNEKLRNVRFFSIGFSCDC